MTCRWMSITNCRCRDAHCSACGRIIREIKFNILKRRGARCLPPQQHYGPLGGDRKLAWLLYATGYAQNRFHFLKSGCMPSHPVRPDYPTERIGEAFQDATVYAGSRRVDHEGLCAIGACACNAVAEGAERCITFRVDEPERQERNPDIVA